MIPAMADLKRAREIAKCFQLPAALRHAEVFPGGHINDSFLVSCEHPPRARFLLQRLNADVFPNPDLIMENIQRVSDHVVDKLQSPEQTDNERRFLTLIGTQNASPFTKCQDGDIWRMYEFIEGSVMHESARSPLEAEQAGLAFGEFQVLLDDLPDPTLHEIIPDFHHTPKRIAQFKRTVEADKCQRVATALSEIDFVLSLESQASLVVDGLASGRLTERAVHNDAKMSNVLLDHQTGHRLCVIDLDTVMPGSALYDFGDMMRTMLCAAPEDEIDLDRVRIDLKMFEALAAGYLRGARSILNQDEMEMLAFSGILITLETGMRFLTDHLEGDHYFRIQRSGQNLDRARCQFQLVRSMMKHQAVMEAKLGALGTK